MLGPMMGDSQWDPGQRECPSCPMADTFGHGRSQKATILTLGGLTLEPTHKGQ